MLKHVSLEKFRLICKCESGELMSYPWPVLCCYKLAQLCLVKLKFLDS